jgi:shikimate dehydrogenase
MYKGIIVGNPVEHSLSPLVFDLLSGQFALQLAYSKVLAVDTNEFKAKVLSFFKEADNLVVTVTSPFKNLAYQIADDHTARSAFSKAGNFLRIHNGRLLCDTTDGTGLLNDIMHNKKFKLTGTKILIIGSGFVLDSILLDMIVQNPAHISILARNQERLTHLSTQFATTAFNPKQSYDIVFNSTPNLPDNVLFSQIKKLSDGALCYDLTYAKESVFLQHMKQINPTICGYDGLGMLVEQAVIVFQTLFSYKPDGALVLRQLASLGYR